MNLPRDTITTCQECGWKSPPTTAKRAEYALRQHSCDRHRRKVARAQRHAERTLTVDRSPKPCSHPVANHQHGTYLAYTLDHCRCAPCVKAKTRSLKQYRLDAITDGPRMVPPDRARAHVDALLAAGMSTVGITIAAGWKSRNQLHQFRYNVKRIHRDTEARILAVTLQDDQRPTGYVPLQPTRDRIKSLNRTMTYQEIADRTGRSPDTIGEIARGEVRHVQRRTADAVERLYREVNPRVHLEDVEELVRQGETWDSTAQRLRVTRKAIERALYRHERSDLVARLTHNTQMRRAA